MDFIAHQIYGGKNESILKVLKYVAKKLSKMHVGGVSEIEERKRMGDKKYINKKYMRNFQS